MVNPALRKTLLYKKLLVKCCWNWHLEFRPKQPNSFRFYRRLARQFVGTSWCTRTIEKILNKTFFASVIFVIDLSSLTLAIQKNQVGKLRKKYTFWWWVGNQAIAQSDFFGLTIQIQFLRWIQSKSNHNPTIFGKIYKTADIKWQCFMMKPWNSQETSLILPYWLINCVKIVWKRSVYCDCWPDKHLNTFFQKCHLYCVLYWSIYCANS